MTAIVVRAISRQQAEEVCARGEDHFFDRKARAIRVARLSKTVSAFANADGGEIAVGIADDGSLDPFTDFEAMNGVIQGLDDLFPMSVDLVAEGLQLPEGEGFVLLLTVMKSTGIVTAADKIAYVRRGAQGLPYTTEEQMRTLRRTKGITSHETETLAFDLDEITNSLVINKFLLEQVPTAEPDAWLRKQRLVINDRPTVTGTLLFHDEPQIHLPKAAVKLYRYDTDRDGSRETLVGQPRTVEGDCYTLIYAAVQATVDEVATIQVASEEGLTTVEYPREALHEIVTNAVLHRDYSMTDDVHIRIFQNRIEVESPGRLPAHVTPANILAERFARNGTLVRLINKFPDPPNKDVGEGLNTAFEAMNRLGLQDPEISERENSVLVVVRHSRLAAPEARLVKWLEDEQEKIDVLELGDEATINNSAAREITGVQSEQEMRRILRKAVDLGQIERVPGTIKGGSKYRLRQGRVRRPPVAGDEAVEDGR